MATLRTLFFWGGGSLTSLAHQHRIHGQITAAGHNAQVTVFFEVKEVI